MIDSTSDARAALRWSVYGLLIAIATGNMLGRIFAVNSVDTIRLEQYRIDEELKSRLKKRGLPPAEVDKESRRARDERTPEYVTVEEKWRARRLQRPFLSGNDRSRWCNVRSLVEYGKFEIDEIHAQPGWDTIDVVQHRGRDGELHLYSSKPPLFTVLVAAPYWLIYKATGWTLGDHPYEIGRAMLVLVNVLPLGVYFVLLAKLVERYGQTDFAKLAVMAAATMGTFLTTFAVVFNNHIPAAISALVAFYAVLRIFVDGERSPRYFILAGVFAAFTFVNELPALAFFAAVTVGLFWYFPRQSLVAYAPSAALVMAAYFGTNYIAHDTWRLPYTHRSETDPEDNWYKFEYLRDGKVQKSYWTTPRGIDVGESSAFAYAVNVLVGQHGVFSLTPFWLLSAAGLGMLLLRGPPKHRVMSLLIVGVSLVCMAFYLSREQLDRNYGGMTSGFRWVFWMAPLWLYGALPAANAMSNTRLRRIVVYFLIAASVLSASYPIWNPWTLPWIRNLFLHFGWSEMPG